MGSLTGQRAVVSGIAGAYAASIVRALASQGAAIVAVDRSAEALSLLTKGLGDGPNAVASLVCDMTEAGIVKAVADLTADEPIDILVTCPPPSTERPSGDLREVLTSTVEPAFHWTAAAAAVMRERGASVIVHVTGLSGLGGWRGWHAGGAAFSGIHSLVKTFALDLAPHGVRVNALVPGVTAAQGTVLATFSGQSIDAVRARIPLGVWMSEQDLGNALIYLVHPSSSYVTGEILAVDGGWDMWGRLHAAAEK